MPSLTYNYSSPSSSSSHSSLSPASLLPYFNLDPFCITPSTWSVAEDVAQMILNRVHPTLDADQKRKDVTDYLQTLIGSAIHAEFLMVLTALSATKSTDALASEIRAILDKQQRDKAGHYEICDVQIIDAEVKLVKCIIQNITVDISFNQLGGICTLCFLEQVDRLIGRDHIFKRSIVLIKAWCYYESRILGAHHGLISTYALETLVLYIFNMFHSSIDGPVAVLYRFLDYFSKFDWDNYCISLNGPVPRAALPDVLDIPFANHKICVTAVNHPSARKALQPDSPNSGTTTLDIMSPDETDCWLSEAHFPALCEVKSRLHPSSESSVENSCTLSPDKLEFGSFKRSQSYGPSSERGVRNASLSDKANHHGSSVEVTEDTADGSCELVSTAKLTCVADQTLELEDTAEFPPLSM